MADQTRSGRANMLAATGVAGGVEAALRNLRRSWLAQECGRLGLG